MTKPNQNLEPMNEAAMFSHEQSMHPKPSYQRFLSVITIQSILTMTLLVYSFSFFVGIASAQGPSGQEPPSNPMKLATGWWSPDTAGDAVAPHLVISMVKLDQFGSLDLLPSSAAQPISSRPAESTEVPTVSQSYLSPDAQIDAYDVLTGRNAMRGGSLIDLLETAYTQWDSSLADSRSLVHVNGVSVYPLMQVTYTGWRLPISLYIPPLRGSDAR
jgi:hypothetical protein